ncbi:hypothetical protein MJO29_000335 [Puccinia striiformis f. sp. tritici]|nr:hypothetical protein MJO29_000335 [Puccinia striiformis f. sp. tritici]
MQQNSKVVLTGSQIFQSLDTVWGRLRRILLEASIIKSCKISDPHQDQGKHQASFAISPHRGQFLESDVPEVAAAFNNPLHVRYLPHNSRPSPSLEPSPQIFRLEVLGSRNVFLDIIKRSEDDTFAVPSRKPIKTVVIRLYEAYGGSAVVNLITSLQPINVFMVGILEREIEAVQPYECNQSIVDAACTTTHSLPQPRSVTEKREQDLKQALRLKFKPFQPMTLKFVL